MCSGRPFGTDCHEIQQPSGSLNQTFRCLTLSNEANAYVKGS